MMELERFPESLRERAVEIGQVLKMEMHPSDRVTPKHGNSKEKCFVVIGKSEGSLIAAVLINSKINPHWFSIIGPYQHEIKPEKYDFLAHDSFIDGYSIREFEISRVMGSARYLGQIDEQDLKEAIDHVCNSPNVKRYLLKKYQLIG